MKGWRAMGSEGHQGGIEGVDLGCGLRRVGDRGTHVDRHFLKPFLKGKILRSSERGVNSILTTILRF